MIVIVGLVDLYFGFTPNQNIAITDIEVARRLG